MSLLCMRHVFFLYFLRLNFLLMRIFAACPLLCRARPLEEDPPCSEDLEVVAGIKGLVAFIFNCKYQ